MLLSSLRQVIAAAKEPGNYIAVNALFDGLTKANFRVELADIVFFHLQPQFMEHPTPLEYADPQSRMERASALAGAANCCATQGMSGLVGFSPQNLRPQLVRRILAHLDDFAAWLGFLSPARICAPPTHLIQYTDPSGQCATLLFMLDFEGCALTPALHNSPQVVDYAIASWISKDPVKNELCFNLDEDARCPIMHLFSRFLFADETRERIFDVLFGAALRPKRLRNEIIRATVFRCKLLADLSREELENLPDRSVSGPKLIFKYLEMIIGIVQQLSIHDDMRAAFMKSEFFEEFTKVLQIWLLERSHREKDRKDRYHGFHLMALAMSLVDQWDTVNGVTVSSEGFWKNSTVDSVRLVQGGFVAVLLEGLRSIPVRDREHEVYCRDSLDWLHNACNQHPCLLKPVSSEFIRVLGESFWRTSAFNHTRWDKHFKLVALDIVAGHLSRDKKSYSLCDNLGVRFLSSLPFPSTHFV